MRLLRGATSRRLRPALLALLVLALTGGSCLRNVRLQLIPEKVERGQEVRLLCHYELEEAPLYSLKWYRGTHEFYRYSPSETPPTKIFSFSWITVDPLNSNESQVTIRDVDFPLSGNFSCEVTTDAPNFSTASSSGVLSVVSVPKAKPVIVSERGRYEPGDTLRANCSAPASQPPARLSFTLNDRQVGETKRQTDGVGPATEPNEQRTELKLHLQPFHYINGQLNLRCTAKIEGIYEQSSELQLSGNLREPVPERVRSENASKQCHRRANLMVALLIAMQLHFR
ncbi:uncharacterized protein LOC131664235 [Phymastichus coffea]|uniref:uncharacterized protein LOC131664235 n=1 Tax=Phymastichus coffea TaxID=108790 RepID=UPI00273AB406|nr:uncharacterized protein LOC131664235 [Phymastichus coffea]